MKKSRTIIVHTRNRRWRRRRWFRRIACRAYGGGSGTKSGSIWASNRSRFAKTAPWRGGYGAVNDKHGGVVASCGGRRAGAMQGKCAAATPANTMDVERENSDINIIGAFAARRLLGESQWLAITSSLGVAACRG